jgi:hypothetical protein
MAGDRCRSQAIASCCGVTPCAAAMGARVDATRSALSPPSRRLAGCHGEKTAPASSAAASNSPAFNPNAYPAARDAIYAAGGSLIASAHEAKQVDPSLDIDDVMRFAIGVSLGVYRDDDQRERVFRAAVKGLSR